MLWYIEEVKTAPTFEYKTNETEISIEQLKELYEKTKGNEQEGKSKLGLKGESFFLYIDCRFSWTLDLLKEIADKYHFPPVIEGIALGYMDEGIEVISKFLVKSIKHKITFLWINYVALDKFESQFRLDLTGYIDAILFAADKVKDWIALNYSRLDSNTISSLFKAAKQVNDKIDFDNSSLKIDEELDFGDKEYKLQKISMEDSFVKWK